jgi:hypothetical protein
MAADNDSWTVGQRHWNGSALYDESGAKATTGTLTIQYVVIAADGSTEYLQSDLTTVNATPASISIPYVGSVGAHAHLLQIPEALRGLTGEIIVTDPTSGEEWRESFTVASSGSSDGLGSIVIIPD